MLVDITMMCVSIMSMRRGDEVDNKLSLLRFKANKMSQKELAEAVGVGLSTVARWERDINHLTVGNLMKVCDVFSLTPNELLLEEDGE